MNNAFIPLSVPNFSGNEKTYVNDAVVSEWVSTGGSMVGQFEEKLAAYVGMPKAVACNSGTSGLHLALLAGGVQPGEEVLAPTLTFIAAVNPIRYCFAHPVFFGCDDTLCIDAEAVADFCEKDCEMRAGKLYNKSSGRRVAAIMAVHVFGNMVNLPRLLQVAQKFNLVLIEDASEALGTYYTSGPLKGRYAGTIGDIGVYSFNGNKIITTGSGGMLVSNHANWAEHAKHLSTQAKSDELYYTHDEIGYNYRLTNVQAAMGLAQLEQLEGFITHKNEMYNYYHGALDGKCGLRLLPFCEDIRSNRWFYSLYLEDYPLSRDTLIARLAQEKIQTRPIWGLIHEQPPYHGSEHHAMGKAQNYHKRIINIPCSTNLTYEQADRVIKTLLELAK